ncbi:hypothetical protein MACH17_08810 [Phaeobacter inhibens]|uniref:TFIIB-type zinc ribbon-containing protein n=1 Tax=Phaeobacter inhibens TaxID=221822 RepID=UPI00275A8A40|nr:zf-TFIIB domain-containing protein [Phaeobacter inhibens]GLO69364.1 hypothetical protein MACH17_08810 [Phaeobacter inhibens]
MQCPIDGTQLVMTDRAGVEIDYCPQCRGVWLDRGELDKIIERSSSHQAPDSPRPDMRRAEPRQAEPRRDDYRSDKYEKTGYDDGKRYKKKKKVSDFLEDLFDF